MDEWTLFEAAMNLKYLVAHGEVDAKFIVAANHFVAVARQVLSAQPNSMEGLEFGLWKALACAGQSLINDCSAYYRLLAENSRAGQNVMENCRCVPSSMAGLDQALANIKLFMAKNSCTACREWQMSRIRYPIKEGPP